MSDKEQSENQVTRQDLVYRGELLKSANDFLGVFAFTVIMNVRFPNKIDKITTLDFLLDKWEKDMKESRASLSNVFSNNAAFDEDDDEDVKRILCQTNMISDQPYIDALKYVKKLVRNTALRMFEW